MKSVVCDGECLVKLLDALQQHSADENQEKRESMPLKCIIALDTIPESERERAAALELQLISWDDLLALVWSFIVEPVKNSHSVVFSYLYPT